MTVGGAITTPKRNHGVTAGGYAGSGHERKLLWERTGRDSNPRYAFDVYTLSRLGTGTAACGIIAHPTALASHALPAQSGGAPPKVRVRRNQPRNHGRST